LIFYLHITCLTPKSVIFVTFGPCDFYSYSERELKGYSDNSRCPLNFSDLFALWLCFFQIKSISFTLVLATLKSPFCVVWPTSQFSEGSSLNGCSNNFINFPHSWEPEKKEVLIYGKIEKHIVVSRCRWLLSLLLIKSSLTMKM